MFYCLSDQILEERDHVRDVYTHRKGFPSPLLVLEFLDQEVAFNKRQAQVHQPLCTHLFEGVHLIPPKNMFMLKLISFHSCVIESDSASTRFYGYFFSNCSKHIPRYLYLSHTVIQ